MFQHDDEIYDGACFNTEYCVIGAGAAGLTLSIALGRKGKSVLTIESGGRAFCDQANSLNDAEIVGMKHRGSTAGRFRAFGGSTTEWGGRCCRVTQIADRWPKCFHVVQHQWRPLAEANHVHNDRFRNLFGTVSIGLPRINSVLSDRKIKEQISKTVDIDLCDPKEVARVAVALGLIENPNGIVLFSSKSTDRVRAIGSVLNDEKLLNGVSKLARLI